MKKENAEGKTEWQDTVLSHPLHGVAVSDSLPVSEVMSQSWGSCSN